MPSSAASGYDDYDEVTIPSAGVPIVLSRYHAAEAAPVVIFLPGTMVYPLFYDSFLGRLAASGFNVVAIHFLSHGKSPRIRKVFRFDDLLQNVRDTIGYCAAHYGGDLFLLGSSQGGILATAAADDGRLRAVLAHDTMLPELEASATLLNLPAWLHPRVQTLRSLVRFAARLFPWLPVPLTGYLELARVTEDTNVVSRFMGDPLCRRSYPLAFLASLFDADMHVATDGSIACPYVLIAGRGDPLFRLEYLETVFEKIVAPRKELLVLDLSCHILFVEEEDAALAAVVETLRGFA
jgi:alpha-beta hydrolase superfamily lysophospholipase